MKVQVGIEAREREKVRHINRIEYGSQLAVAVLPLSKSTVCMYYTVPCMHASTTHDSRLSIRSLIYSSIYEYLHRDVFITKYSSRWFFPFSACRKYTTRTVRMCTHCVQSSKLVWGSSKTKTKTQKIVNTMPLRSGRSEVINSSIPSVNQRDPEPHTVTSTNFSPVQSERKKSFAKLYLLANWWINTREHQALNK